MKILFLGYSNLLRRRILPILESLPAFSEVSIAKYKDQAWDEINFKKEYTLYDNFEQALESSNAELVYISTVNSVHAFWAEKFLKSNFHVIVDKPATLSFEDTVNLLRLAKNQKKLLAESTVYLYHPQFSIIKNYLKRNGLSPKYLTLTFSFPPLDPNNFRYVKKLGGGAIFDTGVYALSPGRFFFEALPDEIYCTIDSSINGLITSYSLLARYSSGRSLIGHFGFTTEYVNRLNLLGDSVSIDIERVFTTPDNIENEINIRSNNTDHKILAPKSNMFINFFEKITEAISRNEFETFYKNLYMDSKAVQMIINSIK